MGRAGACLRAHEVTGGSQLGVIADQARLPGAIACCGGTARSERCTPFI